MFNVNAKKQMYSLLYGNQRTELGRHSKLQLLLTNDLLLKVFIGTLVISLIIVKQFEVIILISILFLIIYAIKKMKRKKFILNFEKDYTTFLISLAVSVRSGIDPLTAFLNTKNLFNPTSVIYRLLQEANQKIENGVPENQVILEFGKETSHPDLPLFRSAFLLARQEGSSLSKCLERITKVVRSRQSFRRKVKAALTMQKLSAFGIGGSVICIATIQLISSKESLLNAFNHPIGFKLFITSSCLILIGLTWMIKLTSNKI